MKKNETKTVPIKNAKHQNPNKPRLPHVQSLRHNVTRHKYCGSAATPTTPPPLPRHLHVDPGEHDSAPCARGLVPPRSFLRSTRAPEEAPRVDRERQIRRARAIASRLDTDLPSEKLATATRVRGSFVATDVFRTRPVVQLPPRYAAARDARETAQLSSVYGHLADVPSRSRDERSVSGLEKRPGFRKFVRLKFAWAEIVRTVPSTRRTLFHFLRTVGPFRFATKKP